MELICGMLNKLKNRLLLAVEDTRLFTSHSLSFCFLLPYVNCVFYTK